MIKPEELKKFSDDALRRVCSTLVKWEWSTTLGEKPEGWDDMPDYRESNTGESLTKADIISPYILAIRSRISAYPIGVKKDAIIEELDDAIIYIVKELQWHEIGEKVALAGAIKDLATARAVLSKD